VKRSPESKSKTPDGPLSHSAVTAPRIAFFASTLLVLALVYVFLSAAIREILLKRIAQSVVDRVMNARVEDIGGISLSPEGALRLLHPRLVTPNGDRALPLFEADAITLTLNGDAQTILQRPLDELRLVRVDIESPHVYFARGPDELWNLDLAFRPKPAPSAAPSPVPSQPAAPSKPAPDRFPPQGIHVHRCTLHVQFHHPQKMLEWIMDDLNFVVRKTSGQVELVNADGNPGIEGSFYGGRIYLMIDFKSFSHGLEADYRIRVRDARVEQLTRDLALPRPMTGRFGLYFTLTRSFAETQGANIAHCTAEIVDGDLYEYPMIVRAIGILNLDVPHDAKIDTARLAFTVHRYKIDIQHMDFLSDSVSLCGKGVCDLFGQDMDVVLVPQFGRTGSINPFSWLLSGIFTAHLEGPVLNPHARVVPLADYTESERRILQEALKREQK
jgi:hypothetical protein